MEPVINLADCHELPFLRANMADFRIPLFNLECDNDLTSFLLCTFVLRTGMLVSMFDLKNTTRSFLPHWPCFICMFAIGSVWNNS